MDVTLRLSVRSPVVTRPAGGGPWEKEGTIEDVARVAETADRAGYDHITCSEHIGIPAADKVRRGLRYWDPLATFGYLAARTEQIRFLTYVLVLGYHHPLEIAKRYGTLDVVSNGRVVLGLGVGTLKEEFDLIGAPFDDRAARADDALRALRACLSQREPSYSGEYYEFGGLIIEPCAVQERVPLWVGGRTLRSLRRAVTLADGWCPFSVTPAQAREWFQQVERPPGFEVTLVPERPFSPLDDPQATADALGDLAEAGATIAVASFRHETIEEYLEQLEALAEINAKL